MLLPTSTALAEQALVATLLITITFLPARAAQDPIEIQRRGIERLEQSLEYFRKTGDTAGLMAQLEAAEVDLRLAHGAFQKEGNAVAQAFIANKLGVIARLKKNEQDARNYHLQAYELAAKAGHAGHQAKALLGLAMIELYRAGTHDYEAVAKFVDEAINITVNTGFKTELCEAYELESELRIELGEIHAAGEAIAREMQLAPELPDRMRLYFAFLNRGNLYRKIAASADTQRGVATALEAVNRARSDYEKARAVVTELGYQSLVSAVNGLMSVLATQTEHLKHVERMNNFAMMKVFSPKKVGDVLVNQEFLSSPTDPIKPESVDQGEAYLKRGGDSATNYYARALLRERSNDYDEALGLYLKAATVLETDTGNLHDEKRLGTFLDDKIQIYYQAVLHLLQRKRYAEAFELLETSRSRAMNDLLRSQDVKLAANDQNLYAEYLKLTANISVKHQELFRERNEPESLKTSEKIRVFENDLSELEDQQRNLLKRMEAAQSKLTALVARKSMTLADVQRSIAQKNYDILYYLVLDVQVVLWHVSAEENHVVSIFLPRAALISKVKNLRESLATKVQQPASEFDPQIAREFFLFLIQPALKWVKSNHLVIIPHEDLNYVPFQAFYDPVANQYVGERFQISYAPSATVLVGLKEVKTLRGGRLLAVADKNISAAEAEVTTIAKQYPQQSKIVIGYEVKEEEVKSLMRDYDLIHLSVHGKFEREPLLSYLKLSPGKLDDGRLTTAEMFGLPLDKVKLVVLSACETGQSKATRANEVLGMQRALLYAGANSLVLSSWAVDATSTSLWMETFYREGQTKPPSEAARLALIAVKDKYRHPYYWSPFLLIGQ